MKQMLDRNTILALLELAKKQLRETPKEWKILKAKHRVVIKTLTMVLGRKWYRGEL